MAPTFSVVEASEISEVPVQIIRNTIAARIIIPAREGGTGNGNGHQLSIMHVFALTVGARYRDEGSTSDRATGVTRFLGTLTVEELKEHFEAGRTFPVPAAMLGEFDLPGIMVEPPALSNPGIKKLLAKIDLVSLFAEVNRRAAKLSRKREAVAK